MTSTLAKVAKTPTILKDCVSTWAQYTPKSFRPAARDKLRQALNSRNIPTAIYYPLPLHQQTAYRRYPVGGNEF